MWIDVGISAGLAILTMVMGYLGVHLTMHPAESRKARRVYKGAFCSCAILMVILVVCQGIRASNSRSRLEGQISDLREKLTHTHIHFNTNAIALATGDATRFKVPPTMAQIFAMDGKAEFNVDYQNVGPSNSEHTGATGAIFLAEAEPNLDSLFSALDAKFKAGWVGDELVPQDHRFFTASSRPLSTEDIAKLDHGTMGLYLLAKVKFSDPTGDYEQDFCGWLQLPLPSSELVWHDCGSHESEKKL
jgi:hypothetical protein